MPANEIAQSGNLLSHQYFCTAPGAQYRREAAPSRHPGLPSGQNSAPNPWPGHTAGSVQLWNMMSGGERAKEGGEQLGTRLTVKHGIGLQPEAHFGNEYGSKQEF